jgi:ribonuclease HI
VPYHQQKQQKTLHPFKQQKHKKSEEAVIHAHLMIFSDGGARGNPGPAAIAFIIQSETGKVLATNSRYIGVNTNNQAEYQALIAALERGITLRAEKATCHLDSELVVKQLSYEYKVKNQELRKLWQKIQELKRHFSDVKFVNVPRSHPVIQKVDKLVNLALDSTTKS